MKALNFAQTCPWQKFEPATLAFCEKPLCGWIVEPANTWTNISYFLAALWIYRSCRQKGNPHLVGVAWVSFLTGVGSSFFHATKTFWGQMLDFGAMYLFSALLLVSVVARIYSPKKAKLQLLYLILVIGSSGVLFFTRRWGLELLGAQIGVYLFLEFKMAHESKINQKREPLYWGLGIFAVAYVIWWLDFLKLACEPNMHWISGHGIWHLLTGFTYVFVYRYLTHFKVLRQKYYES